jgi:hypothetical protein
MADPKSRNGGILLYVGIIIALGVIVAAGVYFGS